MKSLPEYSQKYQENKKQTSTISQEASSLERSKQRVVNDFLRITNSITEGDAVFFYGGRPVKSVPADVVRTTAELHQNDLNKLLIRNIILNSLMSLETTATFSGYAFAKYLEGERAFGYVQRSDLHSALSLVRKHVGSGMCFDIIKSVVTNMGIVEKLNFVLSESRHQVVMTKKSEWSIKGTVPFDFKECLLKNRRSVKIDQTRILFVDGVVEKVSEIHNFLETSSGHDSFGVIMAHNFSPDVVNTLKQNFENNKLKIVPYCYQPEAGIAEHMYKMNVSVVSPEMGDILSSSSFEEIQMFYDCVFYNDSMSILSFGINEEDIHYTIEIPKHYHKLAGIIEDRVRSGIKYYYELCKHGVALNASGVPIFGMKQYREAEAFSKKFSTMMKELGCLIVVE